MKIDLASGETVIKSWDYAAEKNKAKGATHANLTVTNKRIVAVKEGRNSVERDEIPLDAVNSVSAELSQPKCSIPRVLFGIVTFIVLIGLIVLVKEFLRLRQGAFTLVIHTKGGDGSGLELYANSVKPRKPWLAAKNKIKVKLDKTSVYDIIETVGAIIIENKPSDQNA